MEFSETVRNGVKEFISGPISPFTWVNGLTITLKERVNIRGPMEGFIKENGEKINCTAKVFIAGQMGGSMMESTKMTRNTDSGHINGQMENPMKDNGLTENSTERQSSQTLKAEVKWEYGKTESALSGLTPKALLNLIK